MTRSFTITGTLAGTRKERSVKWDEEGGFDDETGLTALMVEHKDEVWATPTGPIYIAAARPGEVALATARAVFDRGRITHEESEGTFDFDPDVPDGAVS